MEEGFRSESETTEPQAALGSEMRACSDESNEEPNKVTSLSDRAKSTPSIVTVDEENFTWERLHLSVDSLEDKIAGAGPSKGIPSETSMTTSDRAEDEYPNEKQIRDAIMAVELERASSSSPGKTLKL